MRPGPAQNPLIELRDVEKFYQGANGPIRALAPTSFEVNQGEFLSLVGPSGCGKSTLLMLISGLLGASRGSVRVNGAAVTHPVTDLGIVFQDDLLMEWRSALENVLIQGEFRGLPKKRLKKKAMELLKLVGLTEFMDSYPYQLSGGMRQRVSICRALVHDPPLLIMDEPFGALDAMTRDQMSLELQQIWHGTNKTVVFITHSISEAIFLSDRVLLFGPRPGRVVDDISVDIPRPRRLEMQETAEFGVLMKRIRMQLEEMGVIRDKLVTDSGQGS